MWFPSITSQVFEFHLELDCTLWTVVLIWGFVHFVTALFLHLVETGDTTEQGGQETGSKACTNRKGGSPGPRLTRGLLCTCLEEETRTEHKDKLNIVDFMTLRPITSSPAQ